MKRLSTALLFITCTLPAFAAPDDPGSVSVPTEKRVKTGELFSVELPSNPTTGYGWIVRHLPEQVALTGMDYQRSPQCKTGMAGCGGKEILFFKAIKIGTGKVILQYARPFEPLSEDVHPVTIKVLR